MTATNKIIYNGIDNPKFVEQLKTFYFDIQSLTDYYRILDVSINPETINKITNNVLSKYNIDYKKNADTVYNNAKKLKPNDIKKLSFHTQINVLNQLLTEYNIATDGQKNDVSSLKQLINFAQCKLSEKVETNQIHCTKTTRLYVLPELAFYIADRQDRFFWEIEKHFEGRLSKRQLRRALDTLLNLKWVIRLGRGDMVSYRPNPFLEALTDIEPDWINLCFYVGLQVDFFDLLNVPLMNAKNEKVTHAEVRFYRFQGLHSEWIRVFFEGIVHIQLTANSGKAYDAYLPVNRHASSGIVGYDREKKQRIINPIANIHHTIPLKWELFDIIESVEFSRKARQSRWVKPVDSYQYVHFDTSFKLICFERMKNGYGKHMYPVFKEPFEKLLANVWSKKSYNCQYVEVSDFDLLQKMFTLRFVDGKREAQLFDALGVHYAKTRKAPYAD